MKNLANCTPREFLTQTMKIKRSVEKWLTDTDIENIRKTAPIIPDGTPKEKAREMLRKQARENLSRMWDAIAEAHPDESLEVLAHLCFVDPADVDDYPMNEYLESLSELLNDEKVLGFFTSLLRLAQTGTRKA